MSQHAVSAFLMTEHQTLFLVGDDEQPERASRPPPSLEVEVPRDNPWYLVGLIALGIMPIALVVLALLIPK
jgi:hypothetical protein